VKHGIWKDLAGRKYLYHNLVGDGDYKAKAAPRRNIERIKITWSFPKNLASTKYMGSELCNGFHIGDVIQRAKVSSGANRGGRLSGFYYGLFSWSNNT
jgi:hypothetical protein